MKEKLENIRKQAFLDIGKADSLDEIEKVKVLYLGRKGELNSIRRGVKDLSPEEKPFIGNLANTVSSEIEKNIKEKHDLLYKANISQKLELEKLDISLPGTFNPYGNLHPLDFHHK